VYTLYTHGHGKEKKRYRQTRQTTSGRHVTPFYLPCRLGSARALTDSRPLRCRWVSPSRSAGEDERGCRLRLGFVPSRPPHATWLPLPRLSLSPPHFVVARRSGTRRSHSQSRRQVRVWGQEREESRTEAEPTTESQLPLCLLRPPPTTAPCPCSLLLRIQPPSLYPCHRASSCSVDRTNMYMSVHGFHLYTCSIVCRTVRYMARGSLVARSTATRTRALTVRLRPT
jgi:hypothetical protein